MEFLLNIFGKPYERCRDHSQQVFWVCYDTRCAGNRLICKDQKCNSKHQGHKLKRYNEYKENLNSVQKHIKMREDLANIIDKYKKNILIQAQKVVEQIKINMFNKVNAKYCSSKFLEIEKMYKKKGDFIPLIYEFQQNPPEKIYKEIQNQIADRQKAVHKVINKQEINIENIALSDDKIERLRFNEREERIKSILPFKCDLKLKFKASINEFLSKKLYSLNIRGPIVLYVQSHKNMHFGGYSSIMFSQYEEQEDLQNRNISAFLFSLNHNQILPLKQQYKRYAIKGGINFGFGRGDLLISDECQKGNISWAEIGRAYREPLNVKGPLNQWLGGASYFRILEYEIYSVQSKREK